MITYANKTQDKKIPATTDTRAQSGGSTPESRFENNRPEAVAQRKLQVAADSSSHIMQLKQLQKLASHRPVNTIQTKPVIQRNDSIFEPSRGKWLRDTEPVAFESEVNAAPPTLLRGRTENIVAPRTHNRSEVTPAAPISPAPPPTLLRDRTESVVAPRTHNRGELFPAVISQGGMAPDAKFWLSHLNDDRHKGYRPEKGSMAAIDKARYATLAVGALANASAKLSHAVSSADGAKLSGDLLGTIAEGLSAVASTILIGVNVKQSLDNANDKDTKRIAALNAMSAAASVVKSGAASAVSLLNKSSVASATATTLAGGAGLVMGALDIAGGLYTEGTAVKRKAALESNMQGQNPVVKRISQIGIASQNRERYKGFAQMGKGAMAMTGGLALLLGTNPAGWLMLSGAALIGLMGTVYAFYKKRKLKKEMTIDILGVRTEREKWKVKKKAIEGKFHFWQRTDKKAALKGIGDDPLDIALEDNGYKDVGHFYDNMVDKASLFLYETGVLKNDPHSRALIENIGLKVNENKKEPSAKKIAAKLST